MGLSVTPVSESMKVDTRPLREMELIGVIDKAAVSDGLPSSFFRNGSKVLTSELTPINLGKEISSYGLV